MEKSDRSKRTLKLKKTVNFGFLDFSRLEKRRYFCPEELRLNQRFAPQLYLEVVRIGGELDDPKLNGKPEIDYLVKMRRFPQQKQLDRMLAAGKLSVEYIEAFATKIAQIHRFLPDASMIRQVDKLEEWSRTAYTKLQKIFLHPVIRPRDFLSCRNCPRLPRFHH